MINKSLNHRLIKRIISYIIRNNYKEGNFIFNYTIMHNCNGIYKLGLNRAIKEDGKPGIFCQVVIEEKEWFCKPEDLQKALKYVKSCI